MEELIILGTGNAAATKCFNACFILKREDNYFLVDTGGGNGILTALEKSNIPLEQIHHIFISHQHTDHLLGIIWIIRMVGAKMNQGKYKGTLFIYCHKELIDIIRTIVTCTVQKKFYCYFDTRINFVPLETDKSEYILNYQIKFFDIQSEKTKQFGFTTFLKNKEKLTFIGDEPYTATLYPYVKESNWLFHEAFCLYSERKIFNPYEKFHSTVKEACETAQRVKVKNLILWHTEDRNLEKRKELYLNEGKKYFKGNLYIPEDLDRIIISQEK